MHLTIKLSFVVAYVINAPKHPLSTLLLVEDFTVMTPCKDQLAWFSSLSPTWSCPQGQDASSETVQNCTGLWLGVLWGKDAKAGRQLTASQLLLECCSQAVFLGSFHSLSKEFTQSVLAKEIEPHAVLKQYNNSNKTNKQKKPAVWRGSCARRLCGTGWLMRNVFAYFDLQGTCRENPHRTVAVTSAFLLSQCSELPRGCSQIPINSSVSVPAFLVQVTAWMTGALFNWRMPCSRLLPASHPSWAIQPGLHPCCLHLCCKWGGSLAPPYTRWSLAWCLRHWQKL